MVRPILKTRFLVVIGLALAMYIFVGQQRTIFNWKNKSLAETDLQVQNGNGSVSATRERENITSMERESTKQIDESISIINSSAPGKLSSLQAKTNKSDALNQSLVGVTNATPAPSKGELLINTSRCQLKNANAFDKTVLPLIHKLPPYQCKHSGEVSYGLVYLKDKTVFVNETVKQKVMRYYKVAHKHNFHCCVQYFKRYPDEQDDKIYRDLESCKHFSTWMNIKDEYMYITCYVNRGAPIYRNFDFAVLRKSHVEARCASHQEAEARTGTTCPDRLSVLLLGIDSASRLSSLRYLPQTRKVLNSIGAIEFEGHHRVADNTFPNMGAAVLAGKELSELDRDCIDDNKFMDKCTLLWDRFGERGYRTAFVENMNYYGLFTLYRSGFHRQPADYYGRTFFNGMYGESSGPDCYRGGAGVPDDEAVYQWAREFQTEFAQDRHFGYFWISLFTHGYMNSLQYVDNFLPQLLLNMSASRADGGQDLLNNTLLVFMSDHGQRFGDLLNTDVGKHEINLPFLFFVFPPWFRRKYGHAVEQMRRNAATRLTSHFDVHATLRDIAECRIPLNDEDVTTPLPRGISLFDPVPENRSCSDAGVPAMFCSCAVHAASLSTTDERASTLGNMVVNKLNKITSGWRQLCAELQLHTMVRVVVISTLQSADHTLTSGEDAHFKVTVITVPGNGTFEASINYTGASRTYAIGSDVMRINEYGNSSACIRGREDAKLVSVCFCSGQ